MSESLMYKKFHHFSDSTVEASKGHAIISIQREYYSPSNVLKLVQNDVGKQNVSHVESSELSSIATHPIKFFNEKFASSVSIGFPLGVDFTKKHNREFYSTLSFGRGLEYIFQRKLLHTNHLGFSLGLNYRVSSNGFLFPYDPILEDDEPRNFRQDRAGQTAHSVGLRSTFFLIDKPSSNGNRFFMALIVSNNYFLGISGQFVSFGINTGFF